MNDDPRALFIFNSDGSKAKEIPIGVSLFGKWSGRLMAKDIVYSRQR
jgi:hypothetical protein